MNHWRCWFLLVVLLAACPCAVRSQCGLTAPHPRILSEAAKQQEQRENILIYLLSARHTIDKVWRSWHPPAHDKLLGTMQTQLKVTLDADGKPAACTVVSSCGSEQQDRSAQDCLNAATFAALPPGVNTLDFYWTFISDDTMNTVECTNSPEVNAYYTKLVGETVPPLGATAAQANLWFRPYMADLQRRIKREWFPPKGNESDPVVVAFKVEYGGQLSNLRLEKSSGIAEADQAALKAVQKAAPYRPLPSSFDQVEVQFTFDYKQFNGGGHVIFLSF